MRSLESYREEFPVLERKAYLISASLGPVSTRAKENLHRYVEAWEDMGAPEPVWYERIFPEIRECKRLYAGLIGAIALDCPAEQAEAGIVDDVLHFQVGRRQGFGNPVAGIGPHEVAGNDDRSRAARSRDFSRQRFQAIGAALYQRQTMAVGCKNARQFGAYSRRCTGNQRHTFGHDGMLLNQLQMAASVRTRA